MEEGEWRRESVGGGRMAGDPAFGPEERQPQNQHAESLGIAGEVWSAREYVESGEGVA